MSSVDSSSAFAPSVDVGVSCVTVPSVEGGVSGATIPKWSRDSPPYSAGAGVGADLALM